MRMLFAAEHSILASRRPLVRTSHGGIPFPPRDAAFFFFLFRGPAIRTTAVQTRGGSAPYADVSNFDRADGTGHAPGAGPPQAVGMRLVPRNGVSLGWGRSWFPSLAACPLLRSCPRRRAPPLASRFRDRLRRRRLAEERMALCRFSGMVFHRT
ncbi:hypothetical protein MIC448_2180003 [Microbacterium sp. C448]|nr:hypothetical protein MIC448_2180003 [Microbacterium sp. C448]